MNDPIDRQAAIDAIRAMQTYKLFAGDDMRLVNQAEAMTELMMLPSAQPELSEIKRDLSDLISREAAIHAVFESAVGRQMLTGHRDLIDILKNLPPAQPDLSGYSSRLWKAAYERGKADAQPDIIHCGECKHRDPEDKMCACGHDILWQLPRDDKWYCADAERRTDEADK